MKTLRQVKVGDTVSVVKLHGEGATKRRIMDMGITRGVEVQMCIRDRYEHRLVLLKLYHKGINCQYL